MKNEQLLKEFLNLASPILKNPNFRQLGKYNHHGGISIRRHVLCVAFLCYKKGRNMKNINLNELIKGALLHDYYLYDWHKRSSHKGLHGFNHPLIAKNNALRDFSLTPKEENMIRAHMWPLSFFTFPLSKEAWLLCHYDKIATIVDSKTIRKFRIKK
jgi:uncharacterized protein